MTRIFLTILFAGILQIANAQNELIPRAFLFEEKSKNKVQLAKNGKQVFYQKADGDPNSVYFIAFPNLRKEQAVKFSGRVLDWICTYNDGLFAILDQEGQQKLAFWSSRTGQTRDVPLLDSARFEIVGLSPRLQNKLAVKGQSLKDAQNGIYLLDLYGKSVTKKILDDEGFSGMRFDYMFNPVAAWRSNEQGGNSLFVRKNEAWEAFAEFPFDESMFLGGFQQVISASYDGKTIYYTDNADRDKTALMKYDIASGTKTLLAEDDQVDILPFGQIIDKKGVPAMVLGVFAKAKRYFMDEGFEKDFKLVDQELEGHASIAATSANDSIWLVRKMTGGPTDFYLYDRTDQNLRVLFNDHDALTDYELADRHARTVTTRDGLELPVHVYLPANSDGNLDGTPNKPLPTILYVHGGPWVGAIHWNNWFHTRNFQLLANRGYAVINTEFRSTTGLGKAMTAAGDKEWGGKMHFDLIDIADWAIDQGISDPDAMGMWGWSYGGYATNAAMVYAPDMFQAGVSMYGPSDLEAFCKLPNIENSQLWINRVGNVNDAEEVGLLRQHSPINFVDRAEAPLLLTTGSLDERVPQEQVDRMAEAYQKAGKDVVYFYYPEEVHDYREPGSWISFWAIAEQFLSKHLGGAYQEVGTDLEQGKFETSYGQDFIDSLK